MRLRRNILQKAATSVLLCGLLLSPLAVHAEETDEDIPVEQIVIPETINSTALETAKNIDNVDHEFYVGENMDMPTMPMADIQNTDPNNAGLIQSNSIVNDAITEDGQQRWYAFETGSGKLTLDLNFSKSVNVDYDLFLYQYNDEEGTITLIDRSIETGNMEHFSRIVDAGIYYIMVNGYSGHDASNMYELAVVLASSYDSQEVDDRLQDAYAFTDVGFSVTGTIDSRFDVDIQKYDIQQAGKQRFCLKNNNGSGNVYAMDILGPDGTKLVSLKQNIKYDTDLPKCTIFFKVYCSTYRNDPNSTYTLSGDTRVRASSVEVTHAGDAAEPIKDYQGGPYWRVQPNSYVEGIAYDSSGRPIANADVTINVAVKYSDEKLPADGRTDSQGRFKIRLNIGSGVGEYSSNISGVAIHYYDIVEVDFESNDIPIPANVKYFYHFAGERLLNRN